MVQIILKDLQSDLHAIDIDLCSKVHELKCKVSGLVGIPCGSISLMSQGGLNIFSNEKLLNDYIESDGFIVEMKLLTLGGIDFQHREGSKIGSGGQLSGDQSAVERKERLRKLALETIDITKDPYFMKNHLGSFECKLCLTIHINEGNYLAHTQGKRHQYNLGRRAAMDAKNAAPRPMVEKTIEKKNIIRIGRPGYKVTKSRDLYSRQRCLTFEVDFPEVEEGSQPRHRFMSSYEQKIEPPT